MINKKQIIKFASRHLCKLTNKNTVTPFNVNDDFINYNNLIKYFGTEELNANDINLFEKLIGGKAHHWIKRNIYFCHRDLNLFLDAFEKKEDIFIYTGIGPSSKSLHLGHYIQFKFTSYLQKVFDCPVVIQIADEEKEIYKSIDYNLVYSQGIDNIKEILTFDFNPNKTLIFFNKEYRQNNLHFENVANQVKQNITISQIKKVFGLNDSKSISHFTWPAYQAAAAFSNSHKNFLKFNKNARCLIPHAIDQDPYFRLTRDISNKLDYFKPCSIISKFIPPLSGLKGKMSSSSSNVASSIYLDDDLNSLSDKIKKSYSGGGGNGSTEDHKKYGGNINEDIAYNLLLFFEENDEIIESYKNGFIKGTISCQDMKGFLFDKLSNILIETQNKKKLISTDILNKYLSSCNYRN